MQTELELLDRIAALETHNELLQRRLAESEETVLALARRLRNLIFQNSRGDETVIVPRTPVIYALD